MSSRSDEQHSAQSPQKRIDILIAEMAAIEQWDAAYRRASAHDLFDHQSFDARQARREQIQHEIEILKNKLEGQQRTTLGGLP